MFVRRITHPLLILLAIVFLIEAWLWSHLEPIVAWIVGIIPLRRLKALLKRFLEWLPPAAALIAFVVPGLLLFPLKLAAVWLITQNHWFAASAVFLFAKLAGLGVAAFIFEVTKPQLLQMPWFRWLYGRVLVWLDWAHGLTDPIKERLIRLSRLLTPGRGGRALRLLWRIRRRRINAARGSAGFAVNAEAAGAAQSGQVP
jgi:hypothetical protein